MFEELFTAVLSQGNIWAALFLALLFYFLRETSSREKETRQLFSTWTQKMDIVNERLSSIEGKLTNIDGASASVSEDLESLKMNLNSVTIMIQERVKGPRP